jgi:hypothetical protein
MEPVQPNLPLENATLKENQSHHANALTGGVQRWYNAFESLLQKSFKGGGDDYLAVMALSLHYTCSKIALNCCFGQEVVYDDWTFDFQADLQLAKVLMKNTLKSHANPAFMATFLAPILCPSMTSMEALDYRDLNYHRKFCTSLIFGNFQSRSDYAKRTSCHGTKIHQA